MGFNQNKLLGTLLLALAQFASATTWYVNGVNGSDSNNCKTATTACKTIGHAIALAASGDSIKIAAATYTENLKIRISLKLVGSGASDTIIDGRPAGIAGIVVTIVNSSDVTVSNLTIQNGSGGGIVRTTGAGGLSIISSVIAGNETSGCGGDGGGIFNRGTLTITNSTIIANSISSTCLGGGASGGGIFNSDGPMTINQSTVSGNRVSSVCQPVGRFSCYGGFAGGGGIYTKSVTTMITNSTIAGNHTFCYSPNDTGCPAYGGGIWNNGTLTITSSTLSENWATCAPRSCAAGTGAGISGTATVQNSILAYSRTGNCNNTITSNGYNLSSDNTCNLNGPGDMNNIDPKLGPLQNNGGSTQTESLLAGSPAIDAGNPSGCTDGSGHLLKTDQRGMPRPDKEDSSGCDMGAYESQSD
jgi:hypothetical protein